MATIFNPTIEQLHRDTDALWDTDFFQKHGSAAIDAYMEDRRTELLHRIRCSIRGCESPLEAAFVAWWITLSKYFDLQLHRQIPVIAATRSYRLDFVFRPVASEVASMVAVEMDGHDFHERTKEQVTYRNQRDRDLQSEGWTVFHVSGSEFNANPEAAVMDVLRKTQRLYTGGRS